MREDSITALKQEILSELEALRTVDCHSHTFSQRRYHDSGPYNLFNMPSPFEMWHVFPEATEPLFNNNVDDGQKWRRLKGFLERSGNTTMWRQKIAMFRLLFDLQDDDLNDRNWRRVNETVKERTADPLWYDRVTDQCRFETQMRCVRWFEEWDRRYFTPILWIEPALWLHVDKPWYHGSDPDDTASPLHALQTRTDMTVNSLASAKKALAALIEEYVAQGAVGLKTAYAYARSLHCEAVEEPVASKFFDAALSGEVLKPNEIKAFQDHLIFFLAGLAREMNLVFQIHTGILHVRANVPDANPALLVPLFRAFPEVRFDLLHAGYPYARETTVLAKLHPNVYFNMAWVYAYSEAAARTILDEAIDLVPACRIMGFGSDTLFPELAYAHLVAARSCVADVLAGKVRSGFLSVEGALRLARMLFREGPTELYLRGGAGPE